MRELWSVKDSVPDKDTGRSLATVADMEKMRIYPWYIFAMEFQQPVKPLALGTLGFPLVES